MVPTVDGRTHTFVNVGVYDGLSVMQDQESKTLWNHITGEALYGPHVGVTLGPVGNLLQMNVAGALALDPNTHIAISNRRYAVGDRLLGTEFGLAGGENRMPGMFPAEPDPAAGPSADMMLLPPFVPTLGTEDRRRPRMDLGLGVWTETTYRYYPMERIRERGDALIDELDGRKIAVFIDPDTYTPAALFLNSTRERPQQLFTRWYGFALTFPGVEVFGELGVSFKTRDQLGRNRPPPLQSLTDSDFKRSCELCAMEPYDILDSLKCY